MVMSHDVSPPKLVRHKFRTPCTTCHSRVLGHGAGPPYDWEVQVSAEAMQRWVVGLAHPGPPLTAATGDRRPSHPAP